MNETAADPQSKNPPGIALQYRGLEGSFDEAADRDGKPQPHYAGMLEALGGLGRDELKHRQDTARWLVAEQGVTYNVYGDPLGMERPWQLDPIPLIIAPAEWRALEAGLIQRATLLNRVLADCYGPQDLIRSGWLPPALVFAQPDFLRPCHGIQPRDGTFLDFYAADLARSPDGQWWVTSDRTQIPTGAGYALANRLITSRVLPELFRNHHVHRLAGFFREVQESLARLAPRQAGQARVVLLSPGPHNETYFEQVYLARYLGYMLVEGQDLTVRDDRVFLKTLGGLEQVDVILRRVDDDFCDPLELRDDSILGVPGLVEAWRARNVAIANALGCGLLQSPAFMSFLPGLCRHVLGEELKLPSVATWWCGQKTARQYVMENLDRLRLKPAFRMPAAAAIPDGPLSPAKKDELRRRIEFDPDMFAAQERVERSTAPCLEPGGLSPRPVGLRVYLVAGQTGYHVMPGGLTRVSPDPGGAFISMQRGGSSKDTWVVSEEAVPEITLLNESGSQLELRRTGNNLPSRLADNFYWLGRYSERADAAARLLRSALARFNPERAGNAMRVLAPLLETLELQGQLPPRAGKAELRQNPEVFEAELLDAIFDPHRDGSLHSVVQQLERLAMLVRDRTSNDMWLALSQLGQRLSSPATPRLVLAGDAIGVLNQILLGLAAFHGLARENMTRAQAWRFIDMGLRVERAIYLCTLLDSTLRSDDAVDPSVLETLLEVADSTITFRSRYNLLPQLPAVFDLVLLDDKNPRSVLFQINQLVQHFEHLPTGQDSGAESARAILMLSARRLNRADARELAAGRHGGAPGAIGAAIRETLRDLPRFSNAITAGYFAHSSISSTRRGDSA